jgi:CDP-diacylglycerol--glycerol-3-phosphate 3-phosphatidyltransferase
MPAPSALKQLQQRWFIFSASSIALLFAIYSALAAYWGNQPALHWALLSAAVLLYQLGLHYRDLPQNLSRRTLLPSFGAGTLLSLARLLCISFMAGFLGLPLPPGVLAWFPFALNLLANASDFFDGYAARVSGHVTQLGEKLDMDLDGRGLLVATLLAFQYGQVAWWFLLVGFARYLFLFGTWLRLRRGQPMFPLQPNPARRAFAGVQMGFATAMLAPILAPPETIFASALFMIPFIANFSYDWLQVSGQLNLVAALSRAATDAWRPLRHIAPLAIRALVVALLAWRLFNGLSHGIFLAFETFALLTIALGIAGRVVATLTLIEIGFRLVGQPLLVSDWLLLAACTGLLFLGTGANSLWTPEEHWIHHRAGERE